MSLTLYLRGTLTAESLIRSILFFAQSSSRGMIEADGLIKPDTSKDRFTMSLEVNMSNQNKQKRPKYTIEFKQDAAKLVNEKGYTHKQAADNLGISLSAIGR